MDVSPVFWNQSSTMKSFFATLVLASVFFATPITQNLENECMPVLLYRLSRQNEKQRTDRIDTIYKDNRGTFKLDFDGKPVATICYKNAPGTVPLYRRFFSHNGLHMPSVGNPSTDDRIGSSELQDIIGYVYKDPPQGIEGAFLVYRIQGHLEDNYYLHNSEKESDNHGAYYYGEKLFYSLPLSYGKDMNSYPIPCNPVSLYRKSRKAPLQLTDQYMIDLKRSNTDLYNQEKQKIEERIKNNPDNYLDRVEVIDINQGSLQYNTDYNGKSFATICSQNANGTVPLRRGYNPNFGGLHISSTYSDENMIALGYTPDGLIGYVYKDPQPERFMIYQKIMRRKDGAAMEYMTTEDGGSDSRFMFYSLPLAAGMTVKDYPRKGD